MRCVRTNKGKHVGGDTTVLLTSGRKWGENKYCEYCTLSTEGLDQSTNIRRRNKKNNIEIVWLYI